MDVYILLHFSCDFPLVIWGHNGSTVFHHQPNRRPLWSSLSIVQDKTHGGHYRPFLVHGRPDLLTAFLRLGRYISQPLFHVASLRGEQGVLCGKEV
ncbi:unnamed protein product [Boreogadus saida]